MSLSTHFWLPKHLLQVGRVCPKGLGAGGPELIARVYVAGQGLPCASQMCFCIFHQTELLRHSFCHFIHSFIPPLSRQESVRSPFSKQPSHNTDVFTCLCLSPRRCAGTVLCS